jgi:serine/threonine-protein kinase RsbT
MLFDTLKQPQGQADCRAGGIFSTLLPSLLIDMLAGAVLRNIRRSTMKLAQICDILKADVYTGHDRLSLEVKTAFSADLMSDVLAFAQPGCLLITGVTNAQSVRTAFALDIAAIVICRGKTPLTEAIEMARELNIPILATAYIMFETCGRLFQHGMVGCVYAAQDADANRSLGTASFESGHKVQGRNFSEAGRAANEIKKTLRRQGIPEEVVRRVAVVAFEAEVNMISYADHGTIFCYVSPKQISVEAIDRGPGIPDIDLAMQEGYSTADDTIRSLGFGAGMGLANIKKFSDTFEISSEVDRGTYLRSIINRHHEKKDA